MPRINKPIILQKITEEPVKVEEDYDSGDSVPLENQPKR
jgi:hypothetical protein